MATTMRLRLLSRLRPKVVDRRGLCTTASNKAVQPPLNLYQLLGIEMGGKPGDHRAVDMATLKQAYKLAARVNHPDVNPDPAAAERFKAVSVAYETLSDRNKRATYDLVIDWAGWTTCPRDVHGFSTWYDRFSSRPSVRDDLERGVRLLRGQLYLQAAAMAAALLALGVIYKRRLVPTATPSPPPDTSALGSATPAPGSEPQTESGGTPKFVPLGSLLSGWGVAVLSTARGFSPIAVWMLTSVSSAVGRYSQPWLERLLGEQHAAAMANGEWARWLVANSRPLSEALLATCTIVAAGKHYRRREQRYGVAYRPVSLFLVEIPVGLLLGVSSPGFEHLLSAHTHD